MKPGDFSLYKLFGLLFLAIIMAALFVGITYKYCQSSNMRNSIPATRGGTNYMSAPAFSDSTDSVSALDVKIGDREIKSSEPYPICLITSGLTLFGLAFIIGKLKFTK